MEAEMDEIFDFDFGQETRAAILREARKYHHSRAVVRVVRGSPFRMILLSPDVLALKEEIVFRFKSRGRGIQLRFAPDVWKDFAGWNILYLDQPDFKGFLFKNKANIDKLIKRAEAMGDGPAAS